MLFSRDFSAGLLAVVAAISGALVASALGWAEPAAAQRAGAQQDAKEPLKIVISLKEQRMNVYRGHERLHSSRVSTGKRGHATPAGVYSVLEKRRWHRSNIYSNAPMPFMQRLTWSGIALHAGHVPNYPASHGCIRLPAKFASELFSKTDVGVHVIVTREETEPREVAHANLPQPRPLQLVTMDAQTALRKRLEARRGKRVSIALPVRAQRETRVAALRGPHDGEVMTDVSRPLPDVPMSARDGALLMADLEHDMVELERYATRSDAPLRVLITRRVGRERIRDVQMLLGELGYDPGPVDGMMGRQTGAAIKAFQQDAGLAATGAFSEQLRDTLFEKARGEPAPGGHLYVRQNFKPVFDAPVGLKDADAPLGTHIYLALNFAPTESRARWMAITTEGAGTADAVAVLDRIALPDALKARLERALTPGSSLIVSDEGLGRETGRGTDFVINH